MTNQKQIARDLGISVATVSNALTGKGRVSEDVIQLVTARAGQLGYVPSAAGRALKTGRSDILGLVMPDITQPVFPEFAHRVEAEADKCGFGVLIANGRGTEAGQSKAIRQLIQRGVDGIIVIPQRGTTPEISQVPVAIASTPGDPNNTVAANHAQGGELAARALLDLGHRNFLLLGNDPSSPVQKDRIAGMIEGLTGHSSFETCWTSEEFPNLVQKHLQGVTAILTVSDLLALRVVTEAAQMGLRCPKDFSVIGFDDLPLATAVRPALSTIVPDTVELSRRLVAYLDAAIRQEPTLPAASVVDMKLMLRESTGPVSTPPGTPLPPP
ncbi:LacI family DNA-binding transcriptional regulator, partial [Candidatus Halocynthiibacter alkanivorans]|uniref:LacI family DNA-binding transcriptional regulator n=1 Tax=Candidatus Halocynthiibacter alkanivorans TaxID=2267619 RepID=UPI00190F46E5